MENKNWIYVEKDDFEFQYRYIESDKIETQIFSLNQWNSLNTHKIRINELGGITLITEKHALHNTEIISMYLILEDIKRRNNE